MIESITRIDNLKTTEFRIQRSYLTEEEFARLKHSIRYSALHHAIFINQAFEILDGEMRVRAYRELNKEFPDAFGDIKVITLTKEMEIDSLCKAVLDPGSSDYEKDTSLDRLTYLEADLPDVDFLIQGIEIGRMIRTDLFDVATIRRYKNRELSRQDMIMINAREVKEYEAKFEVNDWL